MKRVETAVENLMVVDADLVDYELLAMECEAEEIGVRLYSSGEAALRASGVFRSTLWIVNLRLPDMRGTSLLKLIRRRWRRSSVFLIGDEYSAVDELAARAAGATAYLCKPPSAAWLDGYRTRSTPVIRGPTQAMIETEAAMRPP